MSYIKKVKKDVRNYWHKLGPGLTTGAADDDPSGIGTYSQAGAQFGFGLVWLSIITFPLMAVVQEMCARIGLVTGQGLAANIRQYYSKKVLYVCTALLVAANVFNIGADFGAMAKGAQLLFPQAPTFLLIILFGIGGLLLQVFISYAEYAKYLKYLALVLFSYVLSAMFVEINWYEVFQHIIFPSIHFSKEYLFIICAVLGTTISPYLFFWQTSQEVEERILRNSIRDENRQLNVQNVSVEQIEVNVDAAALLHKDEDEHLEQEEKDKRITDMRVDVWSGMFISNVVMFFIIVMCAVTLFGHGVTNITTAADAALALRPFAGDFAYALFAIGIIGTGLLAVPVLAGSSAYAVSESFAWKFGLYRKLKEAYAFYGVIGASVLVGIGLNFVGLDPIKALVYSAFANGVIAPIILLFIVQISSRKDIMSSNKNSKLISLIGWLAFLLMLVSAIGAIYSLFI